MTQPEAVSYRAYFETSDGIVLHTGESWADALDATEAAEAVLLRPEDHDLLDPDGIETSAIEVDPSHHFTIEPVTAGELAA